MDEEGRGFDEMEALALASLFWRRTRQPNSKTDTRQLLGLRKHVLVFCPRLPFPCADAVTRTLLVSVAALYGSTAVLAYVLSSAPAEAARASPADGATPLHLAAATHILLAASASADARAFSGLRAGDLLLPRANEAAAAADRALRVLLKFPAVSLSSSPKKSASLPSAPEARKEYPPDLTLPDLKSGLFSTDEQRTHLPPVLALITPKFIIHQSFN
uniref:Transposase n=1 Tax=Zea mays TaxID=4577 RepID=A6MW93_MAIZE|nr:transposase [Zea mays]